MDQNYPENREGSQYFASFKNKLLEKDKLIKPEASKIKL
jgi:hypothetical protein